MSLGLVVSLGDDAPPPPVEYRWDVDTEILTASIGVQGAGAGMSGSVEIEGSDGSWLILDIRGGELAGVEVSVWPDVAIAQTLDPPAGISSARITVPSRPSQPGIASVEVETRLTARADVAERTVHFRLGNPRVSTTVRAASDLLLELDDSRQVVGVWMLNVPPFPSAA
jgi:hypothetical protein